MKSKTKEGGGRELQKKENFFPPLTEELRKTTLAVCSGPTAGGWARGVIWRGCAGEVVKVGELRYGVSAATQPWLGLTARPLLVKY